MEPDDRVALQEQIDALKARLSSLENAVRGRTAVRPAPVRSPVPAAEYALEPHFPLAPMSVPLASPSPEPAFVAASGEEASPRTPAAAGVRQNHSLESRIGSQWFNRIGILAVLVGMAWFLELAIDNHWIGPLGRVVIGLLTGIGLIGWSGRFRRTGYRVFAYSLQALGSGILYLSLWAAFSVYHLLPSGVASAAMIAVTAFNGYIAWRLDAQLLAVFSLAGGLGTPLLLSTGQNHEVTLLSYLLLLDGAVLALVALRPWGQLLVGAFAGTALYVAGWSMRFYDDAQRLRTAVFVGLFFLLFASAQRLGRWRTDGEAISNKWDQLAVFVLPVANAGLAFLAFYALFSAREYAWAPPWLAVAFAAFYLLLFWLPGRGALRANSAVTSALNLSIAVSFLAVAVPLQTRGRGLPIGWLMEGSVLLWLAQRFGQRLLRGLSVVCLLLGLVALLVMDPHASATPLLNERFATYCVAIAVFAFASEVARNANGEPGADDTPGWLPIRLVSVLTVNALILLAIGWEIHNYWWFVRWHGTTRLLHDYRMYAQFTYSAFFMLFGAVLLGIGFSRRSAFVRWQGLVLLAASIAKVFLGDVSSLSQGYRILSFMALGALLLGVSYAYQRDWLHLRATENEAS